MTRRVYKGQHISASGTEILRDGALAVDLATNILYIHDGVTPGGVELFQSSAYQTSTIRAQRAAGGTSATPGKWTFTTISGSVTAEWVANGSTAYPTLGLASNPYIIFTFTGFTHLPSTLYRNGITGSSPGLTQPNLTAETVTNSASPNVLTAFDNTLHKYAFSEGSSQAEDRYYQFRT